MDSEVSKTRLIQHCKQHECSQAYEAAFRTLLNDYACIIDGFIEDDVVDALCTMLATPSFLVCEHSLGILLEIHTTSQIECLSDGAIRKLREVYTRIYPDIKASESVEAQCIIVLEFIVDNGDEKDSGQRLAAFPDRCAGTTKALLPYGLYYLFNRARLSAVRDYCLHALHDLEKSEDRNVAAEARLHLRKIGNTGPGNVFEKP